MTLRKRFILIAGVALLAVIIAFAVTKPSAPSGRFVASSGIAAVGDFYWECSDGKVYFVSLEDDGGRSRDEMGTYFQTHDGWFFTYRHHTNWPPVRVECSWVGLTISNTNGSHEFWRRRILPMRRPDWMMDWLPWSIQ
jgi:hypothetical protein